MKRTNIVFAIILSIFGLAIILAILGKLLYPLQSNVKKPVNLPTHKYHVGQYVYIHGNVKGYITSIGKESDYPDSLIYHLNVVGNDGFLHYYIVSRAELTENSDTVVIKTISIADTTNQQIYRTILENQKEMREILESDNKLRQDIKDALKYH